MNTESFHTTRWTRVLAAKGDSVPAKAALSELCEAYYAPVHTFIRSSEGAECARDLTHAFFVRLLERDTLGGLEQGRGSFRSYLLGAVKHFLHDERDRATAKKRGGRANALRVEDFPTGSGAESFGFPHTKPAEDEVFDRQWAIAVLQRALDVLSADQVDPERFESLKPWLTGNLPELRLAEVAAKLHLTEGTVKVAIHRLRRRLTELVKHEISETLGTDDETELAAELDYLIRALSR